MFCPECGTRGDNDKFCRNCGNPMQNIQKQSDAPFQQSDQSEQPAKPLVDASGEPLGEPIGKPLGEPVGEPMAFENTKPMSQARFMTSAGIDISDHDAWRSIKPNSGLQFVIALFWLGLIFSAIGIGFGILLYIDNTSGFANTRPLGVLFMIVGGVLAFLTYSFAKGIRRYKIGVRKAAIIVLWIFAVLDLLSGISLSIFIWAGMLYILQFHEPTKEQFVMNNSR